MNNSWDLCTLVVIISNFLAFEVMLKVHSFKFYVKMNCKCIYIFYNVCCVATESLPLLHKHPIGIHSLAPFQLTFVSIFAVIGPEPNCELLSWKLDQNLHLQTVSPTSESNSSLLIMTELFPWCFNTHILNLSFIKATSSCHILVDFDWQAWVQNRWHSCAVAWWCSPSWH